jgi:hypothetical protein
LPTDGNAPRNLLDAPGYRVVDLALSRDFKLSERFKLRFRAEGTNAFNMVSLGQPGASVPSGTTSTTFGVITSANSMRKLQFGLRLDLLDCLCDRQSDVLRRSWHRAREQTEPAHVRGAIPF